MVEDLQNIPSYKLHFNAIVKIIFIFLLIIFSYHLIRDIFQIFGYQHSIATIYHRTHQWCKPLCNYVTIPPEIFIIITSVIVLRRNKVGLLGVIALLSLPMWLLFLYLP